MSIQSGTSKQRSKTSNSGAMISSANGDFKATATSGAKTITITALPFTLLARHVIYGEVLLITTEGGSYPLPTDIVTVASGVITLTDMDQNFSATDSVEVTLAGTPPTFIKALDADKVHVTNFPESLSSQPVKTAAQTMTTSFVNVGEEVSCADMEYAYFWMTTTWTDSLNLQFKVMAKHESAGAEEMALDDGFVTVSGTTVAAPSTAAIDYWEQTEDVSADILIKVRLDRCVKYLQIMAKVATLNTATTIDTLDVVLA